jgi:hypothetical protein
MTGNGISFQCSVHGELVEMGAFVDNDHCFIWRFLSTQNYAVDAPWMYGNRSGLLFNEAIVSRYVDNTIFGIYHSKSSLSNINVYLTIVIIFSNGKLQTVLVSIKSVVASISIDAAFYQSIRRIRTVHVRCWAALPRQSHY